MSAPNHPLCTIVYGSPSVTVVLLALVCLEGTAVLAQTSTWSGGAGNWDPCPPTGNALWNTCPKYPDGSYTAVIQGGPVTLAAGNGISVNNLTVGTGASVIITPGYLYITGKSIANSGVIRVGPGNGLAVQ